ncbi:flagellar hook-length control protein FliK [Rhizobium sp. SAFR-030]|uniref:flagellar hook-length control protein FliK n=1 Tax=Rhizobium sp. SAFR-030 TaxID=3387277 RepID=UPI003F8233EC
MFTPGLGDTTPVSTTRPSASRSGAEAGSGFSDTMSSYELENGGQDGRRSDDEAESDAARESGGSASSSKSRLDLGTLAGRTAQMSGAANGLAPTGDTTVVVATPDTTAALEAGHLDPTMGDTLPEAAADVGGLSAFVNRVKNLGAAALGVRETSMSAKSQGEAALLEQVRATGKGQKGEATAAAAALNGPGRTRHGASLQDAGSATGQQPADQAALNSTSDGSAQLSAAGDAGSMLGMLGGAMPPTLARSVAQSTRQASANEGGASVGKIRDTLAPDDLPAPALSLGADATTADLSTDARTFRFSSTREGRATMDMIVGADRDGKTSFETSRSSSGAAEGVVVLDSRRYLGFSQSQNGAALTSAMAQDGEWAHAMQPGSALSNAATQTSTGQVVNTLKLQMTPIELGKVTATLRLVGEELSVHLTVENRAAHQQLSEDSSGILDALRSQGFQVDQVSVSIVASSQSETQQQQSDQGQRSFGSERQPDGAGGGQGQGQSSGQSSSRNASGTTENETAMDGRPGANAGGLRSGDLYL